MTAPRPTRTLPERPNLVHLKKQAKRLLAMYRQGEAETVAEVAQFERNPDAAKFGLQDAQRVLARAYGFSSWAKLKQHAEGVNSDTFIAAAEAGDVATVRKLAMERPELVDLNVAEFDGGALHRAVLNRNAEMTRVLMQLGADARKGIWPHRDATSAHTIAKDRQFNEIVAIIEQEEERHRHELSASNATISSKTDEILTAIQEDNCDEAIRILESDLSLARACDVRGTTPLHVSAWAHNPQMASWLLDHQASVHTRDAAGMTPIDYAAIVAGFSANDRFFPFLENALIEPARFRKTMRLLQSDGAELTPRAAVAIGDKQSVVRMHRERRLKNEVHFYRGGLLAIAVRVNRIEMVSLLLDLGLEIDEPAAPTEDGGESWGFPLWFATVCGRYDIAELLLTRGADVNAIVYACGDSLSIAQETGDEELKALLLRHGARITVEHIVGSGDRETAQAILEGKIAAHSLNVEQPSHADIVGQLLWSATHNGDLEIVRMCLPHIPWNPNDTSWDYVMLHCTSPECLDLILQHGVNPDVAEEGDPTTLHHIAALDVTEQDRLALATLLLDAGASFSRRDSILLSTPLGWACRWGRSELVRLYLERGADTVELGAESWATPLAWASKGEHYDVVSLLTP